MKKFVSKEKLTKKAQKALNREKRVEWAFKPISRVIPNKKKDAQKKLRPEDTDSGWSFFEALCGKPLFGVQRAVSPIPPSEKVTGTFRKKLHRYNFFFICIFNFRTFIG